MAPLKRSVAPALPFQIAYLWEHFRQIDQGLSGNGFGPPLIAWSDLAAFCALMRIELRPWEAQALVVLSVIRANIDATKSKKAASDGR